VTSPQKGKIKIGLYLLFKVSDIIINSKVFANWRFLTVPLCYFCHHFVNMTLSV
jgi:hypothetical protein